MHATGKDISKSGFRKTDLYPFYPDQVLRVIPGDSSQQDAENIGGNLNATIIDMLKEHRGQTEQNKRSRGKKINPGSAILPEIQQPGPSRHLVYDENKCGICKCEYNGYRGPDWIQCVSCHQWVCGVCNSSSEEPQYICDRCLEDLV